MSELAVAFEKFGPDPRTLGQAVVAPTPKIA